jgi:RNA polymerase sigma-70 factor (ECF subfamily)
MRKLSLVVAPPEPRPEGAPLDERSDEELMVLVRAGASAALRVLAERHMAGLGRFCGKLLLDTQVGLEIAQQTWLQVWAHRARYASQSRFSVFLFTIARNLCRNELRRRARLRAWVDPAAGDERLAGVASEDPSHLDALLLRERARDLLGALAVVPEAQREALLLRFDEELTYEEMAAVLGEHESTLRSRVYHGLRALRAAMPRSS